MFKLGDLVRVKTAIPRGAKAAGLGMMGVIAVGAETTYTGVRYGVAMESLPNKGSNWHTCGGHIRACNGYWLYEADLELVNQSPFDKSLRSYISRELGT